MVGAENPPGGYPLGATPNPTHRRYRLGPVAPRPSSRRPAVPPKTQNATVVLGTQIEVALIEFRGDGVTSHDQSRDKGAKESFAPAPGVMHELEEAEIQ